MEDIKIPEITEVQRLRLEPGDKVAVRVPDRISAQSADFIKEHVSAVLGIGPDSVLVLGSGISLAVVTP